MPSSQPSNSDLKNLACLLSSDQAQTGLSDNELISKLDYHGITLLADELGTLPAELMPYTSKIKATMVASESLKLAELAKLFNAFDKAELSSVLFKGSALAYSLYPKPWLRPRSDNDILISAIDRDQFDIIFEQLGYQKRFAIQGRYVSYQCTYGKALVGKSFINIDLHWQINNRQIFSNTFSVQELIQNGQNLSNLSDAYRNANAHIPSTVDSILIASVHRAGHHNKEERLVWLYDIHLLINSLSDGQWRDLCARANTKHLCAITLDALEATQNCFGTTLNEASLKQLRSHAKPCGTEDCEPSAIFLDRTLSERHYFWADIKSMPTLSSKLRLVYEHLIPPPDYVRRQMNTRWASIAYIKRFVRGVKRVF